MEESQGRMDGVVAEDRAIEDGTLETVGAKAPSLFFLETTKPPSLCSRRVDFPLGFQLVCECFCYLRPRVLGHVSFVLLFHFPK